MALIRVTRPINRIPILLIGKYMDKNSLKKGVSKFDAIFYWFKIIAIVQRDKIASRQMAVEEINARGSILRRPPPGVASYFIENREKILSVNQF
jgi:hypothetical protein